MNIVGKLRGDEFVRPSPEETNTSFPYFGAGPAILRFAFEGTSALMPLHSLIPRIVNSQARQRVRLRLTGGLTQLSSRNISAAGSHDCAVLLYRYVDLPELAVV
jgi:hypothetical protein